MSVHRTTVPDAERELLLVTLSVARRHFAPNGNRRPEPAAEVAFEHAAAEELVAACRDFLAAVDRLAEELERDSLAPAFPKDVLPSDARHEDAKERSWAPEPDKYRDERHELKYKRGEFELHHAEHRRTATYA
jgi:hypothetical protein